MKRVSVCGIEWYRPEDWTLLKACVNDPETLEETYDQWLAAVSRKMSVLMDRGIRVQKIVFNMAEWMEWCRANRRQPDAGSRAEFVETKLNPRRPAPPATKRRPSGNKPPGK